MEYKVRISDLNLRIKPFVLSQAATELFTLIKVQDPRKVRSHIARGDHNTPRPLYRHGKWIPPNVPAGGTWDAGRRSIFFFRRVREPASKVYKKSRHTCIGSMLYEHSNNSICGGLRAVTDGRETTLFSLSLKVPGVLG